MKKRLISLICILSMLCTALLPVKADTTASGSPDIGDALEILRYLAKLPSDYDGSGISPTISDALCVLKVLAKVEVSEDWVFVRPRPAVTETVGNGSSGSPSPTTTSATVEVAVTTTSATVEAVTTTVSPVTSATVEETATTTSSATSATATAAVIESESATISEITTTTISGPAWIQCILCRSHILVDDVNSFSEKKKCDSCSEKPYSTSPPLIVTDAEWDIPEWNKAPGGEEIDFEIVEYTRIYGGRISEGNSVYIIQSVDDTLPVVGWNEGISSSGSGRNPNVTVSKQLTYPSELFDESFFEEKVLIIKYYPYGAYEWGSYYSILDSLTRVNNTLNVYSFLDEWQPANITYGEWDGGETHRIIIAVDRKDIEGIEVITNINRTIRFHDDEICRSGYHSCRSDLYPTGACWKGGIGQTWFNNWLKSHELVIAETYQGWWINQKYKT